MSRPVSLLGFVFFASLVSCGLMGNEPAASGTLAAPATSVTHSPPVVTPTETPIADSDAYWLNMMQGQRQGPAPPQFGPGWETIPPCEAPPGARTDNMTHQPGLRLGEGWSVLFYDKYDPSVPGNLRRYVMVLDWQASLENCAPFFVTVVDRAKQQQREMNELWGDYICKSMRPAANGLPMPDLVLRQRQPSVAVAAAYVAEFCR